MQVERRAFVGSQSLGTSGSYDIADELQIFPQDSEAATYSVLQVFPSTLGTGKVADYQCSNKALVELTAGFMKSTREVPRCRALIHNARGYPRGRSWALARLRLNQVK